MAGTASVAGEVFVDALPYFDQGYDATGVREAVSRASFVDEMDELAKHATASSVQPKVHLSTGRNMQ